jgi:diguanylate cyclase (GGDEF)-like protein/PAS domain S-box-containing protein
MNFGSDDLIRNLQDGVYFVDRNRRITLWNKAAEEITGYTAEEVVGRCCADNILVHVNDNGRNLCIGICPLANTIADGEAREREIFLRHKKGHRVPVLVRTVPLRDASGEIIGAAESFTDLRAREAILLRMRELEKLALSDPLTQLSNRTHILGELEDWLREKERYGLAFGVLMMDIDHFKDFNDRHGHDKGDLVLKTVADTLRGAARSFDLIGRWGGEEFLGLIRNVDLDEMVRVAERCRVLVEQTTVALPGGPGRVTISVGGTRAKIDDTPESLVKRADELMYRSKRAGRNLITVDQGNEVFEVQGGLQTGADG